MNVVKIILVLFIFLLGILLLLLPNISAESLMNPTLTGKTVFFLYGILLLLPIAFLFIVSGYHKTVNISLLDFGLLVWFLFILTKSIIQKEHFSLHFAEFAGLALLYIILRFIKVSQSKGLFLAIIIGGGFQAIYGNLQLWGYYPSHHSLFKLTGSFFNPGPYAGYLASVFPVALGYRLFNIQLFWTNNLNSSSESNAEKFNPKTFDKIIAWLRKAGLDIPSNQPKRLVPIVVNAAGKTVALVALVAIILVLPASQSRAAWLAVLGASVFLVAVKYKKELKQRLTFSRPVKFFLIVLVIVIVSTGLSGMYLFKKDSADGRLLVWKTTLNMIADHPFTGTGINGFKSQYMDYQASWFRQHPDANEAMVAGDTNYAFNEPLQQTAEHGIPGGLLLMAAVGIALFTVYPRKKTETAGDKKSLTEEKQMLTIAKAALLAVAVFSLFSYPAQIIPIKVVFVVALALSGHYTMSERFIASGPEKKYTLRKTAFTVFLPRPLREKTVNASLLQINVYSATKHILPVLLFIFTIFFITTGFSWLKTKTEAYKDWKFAYTLYSMGAYEQSLEEYEKAMPVLRSNGDFLTNYGKALSMSEKHEKAIEVLEEAAQYFPNTIVFTALGDSYKATGQHKKAEELYLHAWYMNPSRFYPKYLLAKLYKKSGQLEKAAVVAGELLAKEVKVESTAVEEIRAEMRQILEAQNTGM